MYDVSAAEFTAEGTADILVNKSIPLWGCPVSRFPDNGLQFCSKLSHAIYKLHGVRKITSFYHRNGNGGVERVNHTMAQMLVNERQDNWDAHLPHVEFAYNNSVSAATRLAHNEMHMNHLSRLPITVFEHPYARICRPGCRPRATLVHRGAGTTRAQYFARVERRTSGSDGLKQLPLTPSVAGCGSTTLKRARTSRFSKRNSHSSGRGHSRFTTRPLPGRSDP